MNTVAAPTQSVNWQRIAPAVNDYRNGYNRYVAGGSYFDCANDEQRRGYMAANRHEAVAITGYAPKVVR